MWISLPTGASRRGAPERGFVTFFVNNLFDTKPPKDPTWTSYPYYSRNWFSPVGRAFFFEASFRFGGTPAK